MVFYFIRKKDIKLSIEDKTTENNEKSKMKTSQEEETNPVKDLFRYFQMKNTKREALAGTGSKRGKQKMTEKKSSRIENQSKGR